MNQTDEMNTALDKERDIKRLESVLVNQFAVATEKGTVTYEGNREWIISFDIGCIPEDLRTLLIEREPFIWGQMSDDAPIHERKTVYCLGLKIDGNKVTAGIDLI